MHLTIHELLRYTDEERGRWEHWFRENGEELLNMPIAGDLESTIGALILHIFGPELRYIERIQGEPVTDYRKRPCSHIDELFGFGLESRNTMRGFVAQARPEDWERMIEFDVAARHYRASIRKILFHILIHELRHWAQITRLMRERGFLPPGNHDLLMSDALV